MSTEERHLIQFAGDERDLRTRSFVLAAQHFQRFNGLLVEVPVGTKRIPWLIGLSAAEQLSDVLFSCGNRPLSDRGYVYNLGDGTEIRCLGLPSQDSDFGRQHMVDLARTSAHGSFVVTVEYPVHVAYQIDGMIRPDDYYRSWEDVD